LKIPATVRNSVWNQNIGVEIGKSICMCCKSEPITRANFDCGHITAEKNGGTLELNNLRPICKHCNTSMGTENMDDFMKKYGFDKIKMDVIRDDIINLLKQMQKTGKKQIAIKTVLKYLTVKEDMSIYLEFLNENTIKTNSNFDRVHCATLYKLFIEWFRNKNPDKKCQIIKCLLKE
jgi:hypothetical protein